MNERACPRIPVDIRVYYSRSGHTKTLAQQLAVAFGAEATVHEITDRADHGIPKPAGTARRKRCAGVSANGTLAPAG
jgi:hypothetical protein